MQKLAATLQGVRWEVIFVDDDSPDGTAERVREVARPIRVFDACNGLAAVG